MINTDNSIAKLCGIAIQHYESGLSPDVFAAVAAFDISRAIAAAISPTAADVCAQVAAHEHARRIIELTQHLAQLACAKTQARTALQGYRVKPDNTDGVVLSTPATTPFFQSVTEKPKHASQKPTAREHYIATFSASESPNHLAALNAACSHYPHVYASARGAFTHAVAMAALAPALDGRNPAAFKTALTARLSADLNYQPLEPSFFMALMCSDAAKTAGTVMLVAGLIALSLAMVACVVAWMGAALVGIGLSTTACTSVGVVMTTAGVGILACRFFTTNQAQTAREVRRLAVDGVNGVEDTTPLTLT